MKKIDFISALNHLSDKTIAEAEAQRDRKPAAKKIPYVKIAALAACVMFVIFTGAYIIRNADLHIEHNDPPAPNPGPTTVDEPIITPVVSDDLPKVMLPMLESGNGFEGKMAYDISEIVSGNPWTEDAELTTLPVYKNHTTWYPAYMPESTDYQKMLEILKYYAERFGFDMNNLEIVDDDSPADIYDGIEEDYANIYAMEVPEGAYQPIAIECEQNGIKIRVIGEYGVTVFFDPAVSLPDGYDFDYYISYEDAQMLAEYFKSEYADIIGISDPVTNITGGSRNIDAVQGHDIGFYDGRGTLEEQIINYNFRSVSFGCDGYGEGKLDTIRYSTVNLDNKLGDYPIISADEALDMLLDGKYITNVPYDMQGAEYVSKVELIYRADIHDEYYIPFYKFYVYLPDDPTEVETGLKTYGIFYVPAIERQYYSGVMRTEYIYEEDVPKYRNLGAYDGVFGDAKPSGEPAKSVDELLGSGLDNSLIDSFYKLRILGVVDKSDSVWLSGYDGLTDNNNSTFYRALIEYDYFAGEERNDEIVIHLPRDLRMQDTDLPPYTEGDVIATMIYVTTPSSFDVARVFRPYAFIYDVYEIDGVEYLFSRGQYVYKLENELPNFLRNGYMKTITSTTYNPVVYHGAYLPEDLAPALKKIVDEATHTPIQSLSNIIPGALAHGGDGGYVYDGLKYVLSLNSEPIYRDVEMLEASPATGVATSYDDIAYESLTPSSKVLAYQITDIYTYGEAVKKYGSFYDHNTLYRAHAFYDLVNDCAVSFDFDVLGWGSVTKQNEGSPMYAIGDRYASALSDWDESKEYARPYGELRFALYYVNGAKLAYHIGWEAIRFEGRDYPNIDLEMTDSERKVITTTANNPVIYTQKSAFEDLIHFFRDDFWIRGYSKMSSDSIPQNLVVALSNSGMGFEGYVVQNSIDELVDANPWEVMNITDGTTLPVYSPKLRVDYNGEHTVGGIDYDYMRSEIEYWAEWLDICVDWVDIDISDAVFKDNALTAEQIKKYMREAEEEGRVLPEEYGAATRLTAEWDDVAISVYASDGGYYETEIEFKNGIPLPDGMSKNIYTYQSADAQARYLQSQFEWMMGHQDAANIEISGGDLYLGESVNRNYRISLYHSFLREEYVPIDYDDEEALPIDFEDEIPIDHPDEALPVDSADVIPSKPNYAADQDEYDVLRTIINYNFNRFEFWGTRYIRIRTLRDSYDKLGDYPIITPEQALERIDLGQFLTTAPDRSKTSADVEKIELIYREDGIPYYRCFVDISDYEYLADREYKTYTAYYVCAVSDEYLFGFEPSISEDDPDAQPFFAQSADDLASSPLDGFSYDSLPVYEMIYELSVTAYGKLSELCYDFGIAYDDLTNLFDEAAPQNSMSGNGIIATVDTATGVGTVTFDEPISLPDGYDFSSTANRDDLMNAAEYLCEQYADMFRFIKPRAAVVGGECGEDGVRRYKAYIYDGNGDRNMRIKRYLFRRIELIPTEDGRLGGMVFASGPTWAAKTSLPVGNEWEKLRSGQYLTLCGEFPGEEYVVSSEIVYKYADEEKYLIPYWRFVAENPNYISENGLKEFWVYYVPAFENVYMSRLYLEGARPWNGRFN